MDKLHDVARRLGVEVTHEVESVGDAGQPIFKYPFRPRLDIAHECLGKLPPDIYGLERLVDGTWMATERKYCDCSVGTFEEAVIALAERFLKEGI